MPRWRTAHGCNGTRSVPATFRTAMLNHVIDWSLQHRFLVLLATLIFVVGSGFAVTGINIDAFPDTTPVQVQINAPAPGLAPEEVERQLTFPVEQSLGGLPRVEQVRSVTRFG